MVHAAPMAIGIWRVLASEPKAVHRPAARAHGSPRVDEHAGARRARWS